MAILYKAFVRPHLHYDIDTSNIDTVPLFNTRHTFLRKFIRNEDSITFFV